jgi:LacI family transcriptional regulator
MREIGLLARPEYVVEGNHRLDGGREALPTLSRLSKSPTALICSNDMTAIGVMRAAFELGIRVPEDLSVIGFDDIRMAEFLIPPLTTIQMSQSELAKLAFEALLKEVKRETPLLEGSEYILKTRLVLRNSTAFSLTYNQGKSKPSPRRSALRRTRL